MSSQPVPPADGLHEELSAYLDGELDAESVRKVEERLARDAAYQAELQRLERAWGLLDGLPRASVDEKFTRSTIEMVALEASQEAETVLAEQPRRRRRQRLLAAAGMLAAGLAGFAIGTQLWDDPNEELLRDLRVIENFDRYYQADSIDFLKALDAQGLFAEGDEEHAG
jgi:anti-sigma factor RsiW